MATKLTVYNNALVNHLGERRLASLSENRKPRRILDGIWDSGFVTGCLEAALWNFATRTFQSEYSPSVEPDFGFRYAHDKPADWVRTSALSLGDRFTDPLNQYNDEREYWFCHHPTIFVRMISDDASYGSDLSLWPESFTGFAEARLARLACKAITQSDSDVKALIKEEGRAFKSAKAKDAMNDPPQFTPTGSWVRARRGARREPPTNIRTY